MKKRSALMVALTALVALVSAGIPALAQNDSQAAVDAEQVERPALGIKAPGIARVGEEVTIAVFDRQTMGPVEGAGVWAVSRDKVGDLTAEIASASDSGNLDVHGELIDWTDANGQVTHTFEEPGPYLLVVVKDGYFPGFALLHVRAYRPALGIKAPRLAPVGQEIAITVFDRQTKEPVEGAGVWLVSRDNGEKLKAEIATLREAGETATEQEYEKLVSVLGEFLDFTDENGQVMHTFEEEGAYLLVAVKGAYLPGFAPIRARPIRPALGIRAPRVAPVGQETTITIFDRQTKEPVEGAGVWLLSRDHAGEVKSAVARLREEGNVPAAVEDYVTIVSGLGQFLDFTDENGQVMHTFEEEGVYLLVAVKDGYFPGFRLIRAGSLTTDSASTLTSARSLRATNGVGVVNQVRAKKVVRAAGAMAVKAHRGNAWVDMD